MDKMKDIKLIALDLVGTTLADSDTLSKRTQTAIESAIKSGITVVAASGRPFVMMPDSVMNIVGLDYAITSNGAVISQCGKTVHRSLILPDDVLKILGAVLCVMTMLFLRDLLTDLHMPMSDMCIDRLTTAVSLNILNTPVHATARLSI